MSSIVIDNDWLNKNPPAQCLAFSQAEITALNMASAASALNLKGWMASIPSAQVTTTMLNRWVSLRLS